MIEREQAVQLLHMLKSPFSEAELINSDNESRITCVFHEGNKKSFYIQARKLTPTNLPMCDFIFSGVMDVLMNIYSEALLFDEPVVSTPRFYQAAIEVIKRYSEKTEELELEFEHGPFDG
ncbi:MAG: hypothetical protein ACFFD4_06675 [Candidatus Odinarchaeota archaeon]